MQVTGNNHPLNKSLSIRLCTDGFSFSVYSPDEAVEKFRHIPYNIDPNVSMAANLKAALASLDFVHDSYLSVQVLVDGPCCHVPFESFEEEDKESIFQYNFPCEQGKLVFYNILTHCNIAVLFCLDKSVHQLLIDHFTDFHLYAVETPLLEHLMVKSKLRDTQKLYAVFHPYKMSAYVMNGGKLAFANSFRASNVDDYMYFLLQIWKSQGMSQTQDELHLIGDVPQQEQFVAELHRFIRQVYPANPSAEFNHSEIADCPDLPYDLVTFLSGAIKRD